MKKSQQKEFNRLHSEWKQAKADLDSAKAIEMSLRSKLDDFLAKQGLAEMKFDDGEADYTFKRQENYSIPSAAIPDIQANMPESVFKNLFSVSYKLKSAVYNNLTGKPKKAIEKHLTIKPSPLSVSVKQK